MTKLKPELTLCLLADGTASMGDALSAIRNSFNVIRATALLCRTKIYCSIYRDYDKYSGQFHERGGVILSQELKTNQEFDDFCEKNMKEPRGGASYEEASVTAFNVLLKKLPKNSIILHYTDAICHHLKETSNEAAKEKLLCKEKNFEFDWKILGPKIKKKFNVITICDPSDSGDQSFLPENLRIPSKKDIWPSFGYFLKLKKYSEEEITKASAQVFMAFIGHGSDKLAQTFGNFEKMDLKKLIKDDIQNNPERIFEAIQVLATPKGIPALTTNEEFGLAWRACISKKMREKFPEKVKNLLDTLSSTSDKLSTEMRDNLKEWIDSSYDLTEEIEEEIKLAWNAVEEGEGIYVERKNGVKNFFDDNLRPKDILAITRGGGEHVSTLMSGILSIKLAPLPTNFQSGWLPLKLEPKDLFSLILHLFFPGTKLDPRGAKIIAILCLGVKCLKLSAEKYLAESKGDWIVWDLEKCAENYAPLFFRFLNRLGGKEASDNDYLTQEEIEFRDMAMKIIKARAGIQNFINEIKQPMIPNQDGVNKENLRRTYPSHQKVCAKCNVSRSITIFTEKGFCAFCLFLSVEESKKVQSECPKAIQGQDFLVTCRTATCRVRYAVTEVNKLNVSPKCAFCRNSEKIKRTKKPLDHMTKNMVKPPKITCQTCLAGYICYERDIPDGMDCDNFVCKFCLVEGRNSIRERSDKLIKLIEENSGHRTDLLKLIGLTELGHESFTRHVKLPKLLEIGCDGLFSEHNYDDEANVSSNLSLKLNKEPIINPNDVINQAITCLNQDSSYQTCNICWDDKPSIIMGTNPCGHDSCQNLVCQPCITFWYNQAKPGCRVDEAWTICPFCKKSPKFKILSEAGSKLKFAKLPRKENWTNDVYGWCKDCNVVQVERPHECVQLEVPEFDNFSCGCDIGKELQLLELEDENEEEFDINDPNIDWDDRMRTLHARYINFRGFNGNRDKGGGSFKKGNFTNKSKARTIKKSELYLLKLGKMCPHCGQLVQKQFGCDHITCICGGHFCWVCGLGHYVEASRREGGAKIYYRKFVDWIGMTDDQGEDSFFTSSKSQVYAADSNDVYEHIYEECRR